MAKPSSIADIAFETGIIAERERIIKLINDGPYAISIPKGLSELATWEFILTEMKHQAIALIKGENK